MAATIKSAVPSHVKSALGGETNGDKDAEFVQRHHGKTRSHMVSGVASAECLEMAPRLPTVWSLKGGGGRHWLLASEGMCLVALQRFFFHMFHSTSSLGPVIPRTRALSLTLPLYDISIKGICSGLSSRRQSADA